MKVWIASHNQGKVAELAMILSSSGIDAAPALKLAQPMPAEGVASYLDNARQKARFVSQAMPGEYVLADDSGLTLAACPSSRWWPVVTGNLRWKPGSVSFVTARKWRWATVA